MDEQMELTSDMRAILVDWMVEVQVGLATVALCKIIIILRLIHKISTAAVIP